MSRSADIDIALITRLNTDATLKGLLPDGVYFDVAAQGMKAFVIVSVILARDFARFGDPQHRRATEEVFYLVKAVHLNASKVTANNAASRIDFLLEDAPIVIPGYGLLTCARTERVNDTEVDQVDSSIRWQHIGGRYRVLATPTGGPT